MPEASITVGGKEHLGWTEVTVTRSMEQLACTFELSFVERWASDKKPIPIREGDSCTFKLDGKTLTTGYVDEASVDYSSSDHTMKVSGRSLTGDLIDCSAIHKTGQWKNQTLLQIAKDICNPFDILVSSKTDLGNNFRWFALLDGETAYEAIERACRMRGVFMTTSANGHLVFDKLGSSTTKTVIEYGKNVIKGARAGSWQDRFSKIIVKAQAPGNDDNFGLAVARPKVTVTDEVITRYRPLIIVAECEGVGTQLTKRATWERNVRAGRSQRLKYTLDGWMNSEGLLWAPNTIVQVKDPLLQVDTKLLVISVRQTKDSNGTFTDLELADPKSMSVEPLTKQPGSKDTHLDFLKGSSS